ncbi:IS1634 family transposase [Thermaurantimonas aggregans]|uniref:IS1634 family transposase n=1 Tax=Thermaurantimonas aggregans TaxID=2173829 RepID=UPI0023F168C4|nr:IS1634 family transposase [Thermaurantimonas aggregans]MCX8149475.1 IS1634 family transposase [Thermaurantimonas aggregans]
MFVRQLKHKNGRIYIQAVEKSHGRYIVRKSFGSANNESELKSLISKAEDWIKKYQGIIELDFDNERLHYEQVLNTITSHRLVGVELILGKLFDEIGFNAIGDVLFKDLVLYRLVFPKSKLKTTEYLSRFAQKNYSEDEIYRYMDKLYNTQKELVQQISYQHTLKILQQGIQIVFYDVTTLYFETDQEDDFRKTDFSKEGKHQNPQIVLGLLLSDGGYPLAYDVFEGKKYEGHTMLPIINGFKEKYAIEKLTVVADSGLLSKANIEELVASGHEFILGARLKNETQQCKEKILSHSFKDGESIVLHKGNYKLIVNFSQQRAKKDRYNREKGIKRLEKLIKNNKLTKAAINKRGYNKFLTMKGSMEVDIDAEKIVQDQRWDGLKGYLTNSTLPKEKILENYNQLWLIEKAFRIAKTDLKIRPIYHYKQRRIEAHICLNFVAYKIYKELERYLKQKKSDLSAEKVIEIAQSIYQIEITTPTTKEIIRKVLLLTEKQKKVASIFNFGC